MGKASKGSRKGKKAWRANISTDDIEEFYEQQTRDAHAGAAAIPSLPSDSLFFVDKPTASASTSTAGATTKDIPVKRKIEKKRERVLYHESVLKRNPFVQPVPSSMDDDSAEKNLDISGGDDKGDSKAKKDDDSAENNLDIWGGDGDRDIKVKKDSLAQAVADEMRKIYTKELGPKPVPLIVPGEAITEEDKFFLDADDGDEDVEQGEGDQDADVLAGQRKNKTKRVTRVEMNKRARRKERLRAEEEAKKKESLSKEIDRFVPAPVQVLLTEEISGSLRQLKGCCNLARDRYKSIEKRGILAPSKRIRFIFVFHP
ncbi:hypothetical protein PR202_ga11223 [Eleusine coracana subsp. coracana]|uniref:Ribosome biogenesis protein NOP53 n=1 Tax=Eleusine coracana subsp. coracana TaxID=191504 RepID=A0AAV5C8W7_ELECO|nr:hypothetical protein PR202_ga11223 [Eleusine coracana subsp. coracana]